MEVRKAALQVVEADLVAVAKGRKMVVAMSYSLMATRSGEEKSLSAGKMKVAMGKDSFQPVVGMREMMLVEL